MASIVIIVVVVHVCVVDDVLFLCSTREGVKDGTRRAIVECVLCWPATTSEKC